MFSFETLDEGCTIRMTL